MELIGIEPTTSCMPCKGGVNGTFGASLVVSIRSAQIARKAVANVLGGGKGYRVSLIVVAFAGLAQRVAASAQNASPPVGVKPGPAGSLAKGKNASVSVYQAAVSVAPKSSHPISTTRHRHRTALPPRLTLYFPHPWTSIRLWGDDRSHA